MKIQDIFETNKIKNDHWDLDVLSDIREEAREIRQTYNKCFKNKIKMPRKKRYTKLWAEYMKQNQLVANNLQLIEMLNFIIEKCTD